MSEPSGSATFAVFLAASLAFGLSGPAAAQPLPEAPRRWEVAALPAVGYDADEGFGYGALAEIYRHAPDAQPYAWTLQPSVEISTRGRRSINLFFDGPHVLPGGWRIDGRLAFERRLATPYFGIGNDAVQDAALDEPEGPNPYYYRFGQDQRLAALTLQRGIGRSLRLLIGTGIARTTVDPFPHDEGLTLLAEEHESTGTPIPEGWSNHVRTGLIRDTRDREMGPTRGSWSELLIQRVDRSLGSDFDYTRWTLTDRRYVPLWSDRVVLANRWLLQGVSGIAPFYDLPIIQTSFKQQEGLGGAKTLRGFARSRFIGNGVFLWNTEVRWRVADFRLAGSAFHVVLTGFVDQGRVWEDDLVWSGILEDLHRSGGAGLRVGMGDSFVVALDAGRSPESDASIYIGLGYLF